MRETDKTSGRSGTNASSNYAKSAGRPRDLIVTADWTATCDDPIRLAAGSPIDLTDREDDWHGHRWIWAHTDDREGWVPWDAIAWVDRQPYALVDYSAQELTVRSGETVTALERMGGWTLCRSTEKREGWVPDQNLEKAP